MRCFQWKMLNAVSMRSLFSQTFLVLQNHTVERFQHSMSSCFLENRWIKCLWVKLWIVLKYFRSFKIFQMTGLLHYKYGTIYREVLNAKKKNWCQGIETGAPNDRGFRQVLTIFKAGDPNFALHKCPYTVCFPINLCYYYRTTIILGIYHPKPNL